MSTVLATLGRFSGRGFQEEEIEEGWSSTSLKNKAESLMIAISSSSKPRTREGNAWTCRYLTYEPSRVSPVAPGLVRLSPAL